jgi:type II secretory pathway component PulF
MILKSGIPLQQAIERLVKIYPRNHVWKRMHRALAQGKALTDIAKELFPWWCPYPFSNIDVPIHSITYLESCREFLNHRSQWFVKASRWLAYPLFLLVFSIFLMMLFFHAGGAENQFPEWMGPFILVVLIGITSAISYLLVRLFLVSPLDVLELCRLCLKQGWSLNAMFCSLTFSGYIQRKWKKTMIETLSHRSFIAAFSEVFKIPASIESSLKMHEQNGQLSAGLEFIVPYYRDYQLSHFRWLCYVLKSGLYLVVIVSIFIVLYFIYFPMANQFAS